ncbi:DinB family protein [Mycobacterium sp. 236(2023)]|uniref:DinB family protein n=1 Tax=Mycobacterium sp. 236(2023) TaxID=3038163 RepID=UPI0024153FB2|nr:DinB family protein [Mycobacterium sp. 236(2023)]MDG4666535.1 DinB family protein [Mycobacterium sp. 236(2023)]
MIDEITRQFDIAWALTELHLAALGDDDFLWEPAEHCWTVRRDSAGLWHADFADVEPDPIPVPTIAWLTWHIDFWWSAAIDSLNGQAPASAAHVTWPGTGEAAVARIRERAVVWRNTLPRLKLADPATFPWGAEAGRTVADTALWVTVELTKNASEIGQLRLLRAATSAA